ncbi:MAG: flagellar basal body rod protein FlgG [Chlamydiales bacterium]|jgi:flagellar basal body rod protein FlgG
MLLGFYSGVSGAIYNEEKLEVTSSNLANVDTAGFRRSLLLHHTRDKNGKTNRIDSQVRERLPAQYGVRRSGIYKIYDDTGTLKQTNNPFDVAIPPELKNAFFNVKKIGGNDNETYYTRNGTLSMGLENPSNPDSDTVLYLGGHIALDEAGSPLLVDATAGDLHIGEDGVVRQGETIVGEIPIFRLNRSPDANTQTSANLQQLLQEGESLFKIPPSLKNEFNPFRLEIGENGVTRLLAQGMREGSNVNPINELLYMMEASKGHASNLAGITKQMEGLTKLFQVVRT